jgi:hypothetical protein
MNRFTMDPIYNGPCMILSRATGLALDATTNRNPGTHICFGMRMLDHINNGGYAGPEMERSR